jgi:GNAT superfamily N-acetyltransferase
LAPSIWTPERRLEAAIRAPLGRVYLRDDTQVIERPGWYQVLTPSARSYLNEVAHSEVEAEDAERVIEETIALHRAHGVGLKWYVGPSTRPPDFAERLRRRGLRGIELRGMGIETSAALGGSEVAPPGAVTIVPVDASNVDGFVSVVMRGWAMPPTELATERRLHAALLAQEPQLAHFFGALVDGEWAGTAALLIRDDFGYLVGAQVLEAMRGRGIYRALIAARLAFLEARGLGYAVTHAQEATSAPILERLGFETLLHSTCFVVDI